MKWKKLGKQNYSASRPRANYLFVGPLGRALHQILLICRSEEVHAVSVADRPEVIVEPHRSPRAPVLDVAEEVVKRRFGMLKAQQFAD